MKLAASFGIVFVLNVVDYLLSPIGTVIIVRGLSVQDYGFYSLISTIVAFCAMLFSLGLGVRNYRLIPGAPPDRQYDILGKTLVSQVAVALGGVLIVLLVFRRELLAYGIAILLATRIVVYTIDAELLRFFGHLKRNALKAICGFLDSKLWLVPLVLLSITSVVTVRSILLSQMIGGLVVLAVALLFTDRRRLYSGIATGAKGFRGTVREGLPLIAVELGMYVLELGDRVVIRYFGDLEELGLYSFSYTWFRLVFRFGMLFLYVLQPYFSARYRQWSDSGDEKSFNQFRQLAITAFRGTLLLITVAVVVLLLNYPTLVQLIGRSEYLFSYSTALILGPVPFLMLTAYFTQIIAVLIRGDRRILRAYVIAMVANLALNMITVPLIGRNGAAMATGVSYLLLTAMLLSGPTMRTAELRLGPAILLKAVACAILTVVWHFAAREIGLGGMLLLFSDLVLSIGSGILLRVVDVRDTRLVMKEEST